MKGGVNEKMQVPSHYRSDAAARHMFEAVPTAARTETVQTVRNRVLDAKAGWDSVNYIYVLDSKQRLKGVLSIRELIEASGRKKMSEFDRKDIHVVYAHSPLRIAAARAIAHNIKMVPVVDKKDRFLGVVGTDTIMDTLEHEHVRDVLTASGMPSDETTFADILKARIRDVVKWRTPWLLIGIFGGMITASIVQSFEGPLNQLIELTFFIPVVLYMGAAVGNQTQMLYIRGVSYEHINAWPYIRREIIVDLFIGIFLAIGLGLYALWSSTPLVASIVAVSVFAIAATAGVIAILVSALFLKIHQDPAMAGGPFSSITQDVVSLMIYLTTASLFLLT